MTKPGVLFLALFVCFVYVVSAKDEDEKRNEKERADLETFMRPIVRLRSTLIKGHTKIATHEYDYNYKDDDKFGFIYDELLGAVVHAGYKTRNYHTNGVHHPCVGLQKIYQRYNNQTGEYELSLNFLDTNNKGDRQPIGMCSKEHGYCGASIALTSYKNKEGKTQYGVLNNGKTQLGYAPNNVKTLCYIFSRSSDRAHKDTKIPDHNIATANLADKLVKVYLVKAKNQTVYTINPSRFNASTDEIDVAFNLVDQAKQSAFRGRCVFKRIAQYINAKGQVGLYDQVDDEKLKELGYRPTDEDYILGFGFQKSRQCHSRIHYVIQQDPKTQEVRALPFTHTGSYTKSFLNAFFYSL